MTERGLKIALAVSVAVNLFVAGAVVTGLAIGLRHLPEQPHHDRPPVISLIRSLDEADRSGAEQALRSTALAAREDFDAARRHRSEAIDLAGAETFDRSAVEGALARSRASEVAGRTRLEGTMLDLLQQLDQEDRQRLAPALARRGRDGRPGRRFHDRRRELGPSSAPSSAPAEG